MSRSENFDRLVEKADRDLESFMNGGFLNGSSRGEYNWFPKLDEDHKNRLLRSVRAAKVIRAFEEEK